MGKSHTYVYLLASSIRKYPPDVVIVSSAGECEIYSVA